MSEQEPENFEEKAPEAGFTAEELIEAFTDKLDPEEDIPFMREQNMDEDEAFEFVLAKLLEQGEEDPEALMVERGFAQVFRENPEEVKELQNRGEPFTTAEADALLPQNRRE